MAEDKHPPPSYLNSPMHAQLAPELASRRIAVLSASDPDREFVAGALRPGGHTVVEFSRFRELAQALSTGTKFDLLLAALEDNPDADLSEARFLRRLAGDCTALVLLMQPEQLLKTGHAVANVFNDFLLMPCEDCELVARVHRALASQVKADQDTLVFGRYTFDVPSGTINVEDRQVRLQPRQFQLALHLFRHANRAQSRKEIHRAIWGEENSPDQTRKVDIHISRLRKLLMAMSAGDLSLMPIRGFGYRLFLKIRPDGKPARELAVSPAMRPQTDRRNGKA